MIECSTTPAWQFKMCPHCRHATCSALASTAPKWGNASPPLCPTLRRLHVLSGGSVSVVTVRTNTAFDFEQVTCDDDEDCDEETAAYFEEYPAYQEEQQQPPPQPMETDRLRLLPPHPASEPTTPTWVPQEIGGGAATPPMFMQPVEEVEPPLPLPKPPPLRYQDLIAHQVTTPRDEISLFNETVIVNKLRHSFWFHDLRCEGSNEELKGQPVGTFFVRPSADCDHLFALSVMTDKGPTSVRFSQVNGHFRLEAVSRVDMPLFRRLPDLMQYYILKYRVIKEYQANLSSDDPIHKKLHDLLEHSQGSWVDENGKFYSYIRIEKPYYRGNPPSLRHFARLAINRTMIDTMCPRPVDEERHKRLPLPPPLVDYLQEYPYCI